MGGKLMKGRVLKMMFVLEVDVFNLKRQFLRGLEMP